MFKIYILNHGCIYDSSNAYDKERYVQKPEMSWSANSAGSLSFKISEWMYGYYEIEIFKTIVYITRRKFDGFDDIIWAGRVYEEKRNEYNDRVVECEGALAFLNDSIQPNTIETSMSYRSIFYNTIEFHNSLISNPNLRFDVSHFAPGSSYYGYFDPKKGKVPAEYEGTDPEQSMRRTTDTTLDIINDLFVKRFGGYLKVTHYLSIDRSGNDIIVNKLDYIDAYDEEVNPIVDQPIKFGENLLSLERTATAEDFATVVYPIGASLEDYDKAWTMYEHVSDGYVRYYDKSPSDYSDLNYISGRRIDDENGYFSAINDSRYCMIQFIPVKPGERFFLTTYMKGVPLSYSSDGKTFLGAACYCVHKSDMFTAVAIGDVAKNVNVEENGVKREVEKDVELELSEIKIPEDGAYLSVAVFDPNNRPKPFELRKFNEYYAETNYSLMETPEHVPTDSEPIEKVDSFKYRVDTYPSETYMDNTGSSSKNYEKYFSSRIIKHVKLVEEFGEIYKTVNIEQAAHSNLNRMYFYAEAVRILNRMTEKIQIKIKALDLGLISDLYSPFNLLDMVRASSEPHSLDVTLPILELKIPLDSPEDAEYTLENEVETRDGEPSYMTVYMSDMYKKGKS